VAALAAGDTASHVWSDQQVLSADPITQPAAPSSSAVDERVQDENRPTRTTERPTLDDDVQGQRPASGAAEAPPVDTDPRFLTEDLNLRAGPGEDTAVLTVLDAGSKIQVTGRVVAGYAEVVVDDKLRWVTAEYLSTDKPEDDSGGSGGGGGLSDEPCPTGSDVESGLVSNAIAVYRAVCAEFPEITTYYGLRPGDDGEHGTGQALDIMITDSATGDAVAEFVQDNYSALGVSEIIWSQQIWTVERASEGWRWMEDRGSDTANHYDHVHVTVY
jgi:Bacterial SH3 domain